MTDLQQSTCDGSLSQPRAIRPQEDKDPRTIEHQQNLPVHNEIEIFAAPCEPPGANDPLLLSQRECGMPHGLPR